MTLKPLSLITCNYAINTSLVAKGTDCFIVQANPGAGGQTLLLRCLSRKGKWITRWESVRCLENFQAVTLPSTHSQYKELTGASDTRHLAALQKLESRQ